MYLNIILVFKFLQHKVGFFINALRKQNILKYFMNCDFKQ